MTLDMEAGAARTSRSPTTPTTEERQALGRPIRTRAFGEAARSRSRPPAGRRPGVELHLITYVLGNLLFWTLWGAIAITTDHWYWWPIVPLAGWTVVLGLHLRTARRDAYEPISERSRPDTAAGE